MLPSTCINVEHHEDDVTLKHPVVADDGSRSVTESFILQMKHCSEDGDKRPDLDLRCSGRSVG